MDAKPLETGSKAPEFTLPQDGGDPVTLARLTNDPSVGPVILFFYPKDSTPGCTTEAREFSTLLPEFHALGAQVFGISKDSLKRHENFRAKQELTVPLLSDADAQICEAYGTWGEKKNYGRTYLGITRTTYLIDSKGDIAQVWSKVKVKDHAQAVLDATRALVGA
ncbi:thioredoxin-dependent thiol peroxidase [Aliiroseovarius sp. KMU-50]|uniref:thioredoxin-dependent peroxiredoxin n=1 Tax=Aliiroseovarius salicola TaxID=3009082 RepID=A0ABT4W284_9RHOB|nr:thioredoxin-dependent thiol peroxidase [Aliiroseovarius sp. KMU-50]MDA5094612.1 thioredoxin-dependent thiol peroxidase [Aliiroseovarius sp. KMU-50]